MIKRVFTSVGLIFFSSSLFFLFNFYLAKLIGANEYGKINYYLAFIQIIYLLISINHESLYMGNKIVLEDKKTFDLFFTIETLFFLLILYPFIYILSHYINNRSIIFLILLSAYFNVIVTTISLEFNSQKKVEKAIFYGSFFPRLSLVILFSILYFFNLSNSAKIYLYAFIFSYGVIWIYFIYNWKPRFYLKKEIFKRVWKFYVLGIIGSSFQPIANILQKEFYGYKELATLSIAMLILAGVYMFGSVLVKFVLPKIHELWKKRDIKAIEILYSNNTKLEIIIVGPIIMFILVYIDFFSDILGKGYKLLPLYIYILMIGFLPDFFTGITGNLLRSTENEKYEIYNEIIRFISGISLIYILRNSNFGVVLALALSMFLYNLFKFLEVYYLLKIKPFNIREFIGLLVYLMLFYIVFLLLSKISNGIIISIIILFISLLIELYYLKKKGILEGFK